MSLSSSLKRLVDGQSVAKLLKLRNNLFSKYLLFTNVSICVSLSAAGDALQQHYEILKSKDRDYKGRRTRNMAITGLTAGIICHNWYRVLDKYLPGRTIGIVLKKVVIDQIIFSPIMLVSFFGTIAVLERSSVHHFLNELKEKSWRLYFAEWLVWPPAQIINFALLPTKYRVLYDNTVSLGFDVYASYIINEVKITPKDSDSENSSNYKSIT